MASVPDTPQVNAALQQTEGALSRDQHGGPLLYEAVSDTSQVTKNLESTSLQDLQMKMESLQNRVKELEERATEQPPQNPGFQEEDSKPQTTPLAKVAKVAQVAQPSTRIQYIVSKVLASGGRREVEGMEPKFEAIEARDDIAFVAKESFKDAAEQEKLAHKIILKSSDLRTLLSIVLRSHFEHDKLKKWECKEQTLTAPFRVQLLYWNELQAATENTAMGTEQARSDLKLLLKHIEQMEPENVELMKSITTRTRVRPSELWSLYRPGDLVVATPYLSEPQIFQIHSQGSRERYDISVICWAYDWTGTQLQRCYYEFAIKMVEDEKEGGDITKLACYPIRYYKGVGGPAEEETWSEKLIKRGRRFEDICQKSDPPGKLYSYTGDMLIDPRTSEHRGRQDRYSGSQDRERPWFPSDFLKEILEGPHSSDAVTKSVQGKVEITVDFETYKKSGPASTRVGSLQPQPSHPMCRCPLCLDPDRKSWMASFGNNNSRAMSKEEEENYRLLPARLLGYDFTSKTWGQFHVSRTEDHVGPDEASYQKLIFPKGSQRAKKELKNLVKYHGDYESPIKDPVAGKGQGLVILLHGHPGVGKTMTAETLAKATGKPLYVVGPSEIGLEADIAERSLQEIFRLSERWKAVLLIDEADVYLDSRGVKTSTQAKDNALVSVMLHALEYFKGIVIMTTNRVLTFDVAMLSRCHYAITFQKLTLEQERQIWMVYVNQLTDETCSPSSRKQIQDWVEDITEEDRPKANQRLNGREIRNVFTTAQTLAQDDPEKKITPQHMKNAFDRTCAFLTAMHDRVIKMAGNLYAE